MKLFYKLKLTNRRSVMNIFISITWATFDQLKFRVWSEPDGKWIKGVILIAMSSELYMKLKYLRLQRRIHTHISLIYIKTQNKEAKEESQVLSTM